MEGDGDGNQESPQVNQREEVEKKKSSDGDEGPSSRINEIIASGCDHDSAVYWESLLHQRSLEVLLVESDSSSRLVIAVLLQKCGYRVTVAANGLQAWKILSDLSNHIDLVLSEVDIPCLSGIALLRKIMKHNIRQHIPVVMMSFSDSISLVFKCLSEGAVDYVLKPVRKNELKNLWQHIWRRWHHSCGSESGIVAQPQKTVRLKDVEIFYDNNSSSNNKDDSASFGLNVDGESDNASGTQGSWTKPIVEVNSPQPVSSSDQIARKPDSNCTLPICSNFEVFGPEQLPTTATREYQAHEKQLGNAIMDGDLEIGITKPLDLQIEHPVEVPMNLEGLMQNIIFEVEVNKYSEDRNKRHNQSPSSNSRDKTVKRMCLIADTNDAYADSGEFQGRTNS